jgi:hypothetical protein
MSVFATMATMGSDAKQALLKRLLGEQTAKVKAQAAQDTQAEGAPTDDTAAQTARKAPVITKGGALHELLLLCKRLASENDGVNPFTIDEIAPIVVRKRGTNADGSIIGVDVDSLRGQVSQLRRALLAMNMPEGKIDALLPKSGEGENRGRRRGPKVDANSLAELFADVADISEGEGKGEGEGEGEGETSEYEEKGAEYE